MYYIHWVPSYFITIQRQPTYSSSRQTDRQTDNAAYYTFIVCQRSCDLLVLTTACSFFLHSVVIFIPAAGNCYLICSSIVVSRWKGLPYYQRTKSNQIFVVGGVVDECTFDYGFQQLKHFLKLYFSCGD